jgi:hypothetical protein
MPPACSILHGDVSNILITSGPTVSEPHTGFDVGAATIFVANELIQAEGSLDLALESLGVARNAEWTTDLDSSGNFYIIDINKSPARGGWSVDVTYRGYNGILPPLSSGLGGVGKFTRQAYSADLEYTSTGGPNTRTVLLNEDGDVHSHFLHHKMTFTDPGVSFQDCYIANGDAFDPFDETKNNLVVVGFGTNWGNASVPNDGSLSVRVFTGLRDATLAGVPKSQWPGTEIELKMIKGPGAFSYASENDPPHSVSGWTLDYSSSNNLWTLTDGVTSLYKFQHHSHGPESGNYTDLGDQRGMVSSAAAVDSDPLTNPELYDSGNRVQYDDAMATVTAITTNDFHPQSPLTDWYKTTSETPVSQQFGFDWPYVRWQSNLRPNNVANINFNHGMVLTERHAEQVCSDPNVKLWYVCDTFVLYNRVTFA